MSVTKGQEGSPVVEIQTNSDTFDKRTRSLVKSVGPKLAPLIPDYGAWYKKKHLLKLNLILTLVCLSSAGQGYDGSLINSVQSYPEWVDGLMGTPSDEWLGFIVVTLSLGGIVGTLLSPSLGDRFGRVPTLTAAMIGLIAFPLGQSLCKTANQYIILRSFVGVFNGINYIACSLIAELSFPTYRGFFSCFFMVMYYVGSFIGGWTAYGARNSGDWSWRIVGIVQIVFPVIVLAALIKHTPESPRWLISKGKVDKAREVLLEIHGGNDEAYVPLIEMEIEEIINELEDEERNQSSWISMFRGRENLWKLFISISLGVWSQWCGCGIISYYLPNVLDSVGIVSVTDQTLINGFLQLWNIIWAAVGSFYVDHIGRLPLFLWSTGGMLVSYVIITGLSAAYAQFGNTNAGLAVVAFLFIYFGFYDIAFTPLATCYPIEIWPYHQRAKGLSMSMTASYAGLLFNQFVNPIALSRIAWRYYIVYIGILASMIVGIYYLYPETKNHSLEEIQDMFKSKVQKRRDQEKDVKR